MHLTVRSTALNGTLTQGAVDACKIGCTIAIRYAADRPQVAGRHAVMQAPLGTVTVLATACKSWHPC